ncbi:hypothetical protein [Amycolatopsis sp.]|nr:hypothetical protein [Amycolatopsis sp.]HET6706665.1 hypothetical protein [Amycolatopsis sp.]
MTDGGGFCTVSHSLGKPPETIVVPATRVTTITPTPTFPPPPITSAGGGS